MSQKFTCTTCNKEFSSKGALKLHSDTICNRDENLQFICTYCTTDFVRKATLDKHILSCSKKIEHELRQTHEALVKEYEEYKQKTVLEIKEKDDKILELTKNLNNQLDSNTQCKKLHDRCNGLDESFKLIASSFNMLSVKVLTLESTIEKLK